MATPTYTLLDSTTLASSASSVTFSSITQDYRDLVLVTTNFAATSTTNYRIRINGDSGTNYNRVHIEGDGSTATSFAASGDAQIFGQTATTTSSVIHKVEFLDYSATDKHKSVLMRYGSGDDVVAAQANRWANTAVISSLEIFTGSDSFAAGSTFYLYGIEA